MRLRDWLKTSEDCT